jgi:hypothetical protein
LFDIQKKKVIEALRADINFKEVIAEVIYLADKSRPSKSELV